MGNRWSFGADQWVQQLSAAGDPTGISITIRAVHPADEQQEVPGCITSPEVLHSFQSQGEKVPPASQGEGVC